MGFSDLIKKREDFAEKKQGVLLKRANRLQGALFALLFERVISTLETDSEGNLKFTAANLAAVAKVTTIWAAYRKLSGPLGEWIVKGLLQLFGMNTAYFNEVATVTDSLEARARKLLFKNLGYDLDKREILKDGWLDSLLAQDTVKQQVVNRLNAAISAKMDAKTFKTQFRDAFLDSKTGLGLVTKNMEFHAHNVFMSFDRATQSVYKEKLGLNYAIYSGTIKKPSKESSGTRDFCWRRVGNLYDMETIKSWNNLDWSGKVPGADVTTAGGGYNCRHNFSWVSEEMAGQLQKKGKVLNKLNPPKPSGK